MNPASAKFECPPNAVIYFDQVANRCRNYIRRGLWGIDLPTLDGWLGNFTTSEEQHLAACILDEAIFRSEDQVAAMIVQLLQRTLSDALANPGEFGVDWQQRLSSESIDPGVRLAPVIREDDSPAKSGPLVARLFRREGGVSDRWMVWPWQIRGKACKTAQTIILIDDFVGSGDQFTKFVKKFGLHTVSHLRVVYAPLIAHPKGVYALQNAFPTIQIVPGEVLSEKSGLFDSGRQSLDKHNSIAATVEQYRKYWSRRKIKPSKLFGWGELNLALSFHHGTPNATSPLFWLKQGSHNTLFQR